MAPVASGQAAQSGPTSRPAPHLSRLATASLLPPQQFADRRENHRSSAAGRGIPGNLRSAPRRAPALQLTVCLTGNGRQYDYLLCTNAPLISDGVDNLPSSKESGLHIKCDQAPRNLKAQHKNCKRASRQVIIYPAWLVYKVL